jgi:hypothetical protein
VDADSDGAEASRSLLPSLAATEGCSKLRMPSKPHLFIIARSWGELQYRKRPTRSRGDFTSSHGEHGVVSICSPVKTALAPAMKHMACSFSLSVCRPAASRIMVVGRTTRAVAIVRSKV